MEQILKKIEQLGFVRDKYLKFLWYLPNSYQNVRNHDWLFAVANGNEFRVRPELTFDKETGYIRINEYKEVTIPNDKFINEMKNILSVYNNLIEQKKITLINKQFE